MLKDTNKLIILGMVFPKNNNKVHQRNWIFDIHGICPTLVATDYKDPKRIMVWSR